MSTHDPVAARPRPDPSAKTAPERAEFAGVPQLFERAALRHGDRLAVADSHVALTYRELELRSRGLALQLHDAGVGAGSVTGVCLDRSVDTIVAMLAVMRAGGAFVPLDPAHPTERLRRTVADAGAPLVLVDEANADRFEAPTLPVAGWRRGRDDERLSASPVTASSLAYVIYTSGSTGTPKGVEVEHGGLENLVRWHQSAFEVTADDRATQLAGPGFDAVQWELWPYLTAGAAVRVVDDDTRVDAAALARWIIAEQITISFAPTALAEQLLRADWPRSTRLRVLLTGADALHAYPPAGLPFAFVNAYGPTEGTVVSTAGTVDPLEAATTRPPSIGHPIDGVHVHLVAENREVDDHAAGELWIAGANVARGYRGSPDLTADRFVRDPFCPDGWRAYRTGDLARRLEDGNLEFLGRIDDQVKIRGHRVEPAEVALALAALPGVAAAHVGTYTRDGGQPELVGYVVPEPAVTLAPHDLAAALRTVLPHYMVPAAFVPLSTLPLTPNGKVDRSALPVPAHPDRGPGAVDRPGTPPAGADAPADEPARGDDTPFAASGVGPELAALVAELLDVPAVSADDDFFLLGGHSLLGAQLLGEIHDRFGVDLPLRTVFEEPTVGGLTEVIEAAIVASIDAAPVDAEVAAGERSTAAGERSNADFARSAR